VAVCRTCHRFKTAGIALPAIAKGKRISDRHNGIKKAASGFLTNRMAVLIRRMNGKIVPL